MCPGTVGAVLVPRAAWGARRLGRPGSAPAVWGAQPSASPRPGNVEGKGPRAKGAQERCETGSDALTDTPGAGTHLVEGREGHARSRGEAEDLQGDQGSWEAESRGQREVA